MAARAAAEVEHRRLDVGEDRLVDRVGGRQPAVERERLEPPVREPDPRADRRSLRGGREQAAVEEIGRRGRSATVMPATSASAAAKCVCGASAATSSATSNVSTSRSGGRIPGSRSRSAMRARCTAPVRAVLIGTPSNTPASGVRSPMPQ